MDLTATISSLWPRLNSTAEADSVFWTAAELWGYADDEAKKLARETAAFVEAATVPLTATVGEYSLPARHFATVEAHSQGFTMRSASVRELAALDRRWTTQAGDLMTHYAQDVQGEGVVAVYPVPSATAVGADGSLRLVEAEIPATVAAGSPTLTMPDCMRELFMFSVLARARGKESPGAMPDVAEWCEEQAKMMRDFSREVWG